MKPRKVHAPSPRNETWALCGKFGDVAITREYNLVTCQHCLQTLGVTAQRRWCTPAELALITAVNNWHDDYVARNNSNRDAVLCRAFDEYERDLAGRRHYTG